VGPAATSSLSHRAPGGDIAPEPRSALATIPEDSMPSHSGLAGGPFPAPEGPRPTASPWRPCRGGPPGPDPLPEGLRLGRFSPSRSQRTAPYSVSSSIRTGLRPLAERSADHDSIPPVLPAWRRESCDPGCRPGLGLVRTRACVGRSGTTPLSSNPRVGALRSAGAGKPVRSPGTAAPLGGPRGSRRACPIR
jgi:hypothetical protein